MPRLRRTTPERPSATSRGRLLAFLIVGASVLAMVLVAVVASAIAARGLEEQAAERVEASAEGGARYLAERLGGAAELVSANAGRTDLRAALRSSRSAASQRVLDAHVKLLVEEHDFASAAILDAEGRLLAMHPGPSGLIGQSFAHRDYFVGLEHQGSPYVSTVFTDAVPGSRRVVAAAATIRSSPSQAASGGSLGVLVGAIRTSDLQAIAEEFAEGQDVSLEVTDQAGVLVASDRGLPRASRVQRNDRVQAALGGGSGFAEAERGGRSYFTSWGPVEPLGWTIQASLPTVEVLADVQRMQRAMVVAAIVLAVAAGLLLAWLVRLLARTERSLRAKVEELEQANRTLDAFSHTLVHDLRNPLTTIGGFANTLRRLLGDADDRVQEMTSHIETSAARMQGLIEGVLALATASQSVQRTPVEPSRVLREVADDVSGVELEIGWLPDVIAADRPTFGRCFENLLQNAAKYAADEQGVAHVRIWADETPWHWRFFVEDDGPGIAPEDRHRVFESFQRGADAATSPGTGLGLSIVAAGVEAHGGSVRIEDGATGGARFVVEFAKPEPDQVEHSGLDEPASKAP